LSKELAFVGLAANSRAKQHSQNLKRENKSVVKVIASGVRKGNVIEHEDGKLYIVLKAESMHPGKGTPTTTIDMRRISDGVKTVVRYKTTDAMERAFVETIMHTYTYKDGDNYIFMNPESFEQITVPEDMMGDSAPYLQEGMECQIAMFNDVPISIELPPRVTLEITETEPAIKNQTASSSFKPAILSNGARTLVPPHIGVGTRIVVDTSDGSYVERAKD
jgi:elongation factor P